jgi:hypothetical protein
MVLWFARPWASTSFSIGTIKEGTMSEGEASAGGTELQFDQVAQSNRSTNPGRLAVECAECREPVQTEYFTINDRNVCDRCRKLIEGLADPPKGARPLIRGTSSIL